MPIPRRRRQSKGIIIILTLMTLAGLMLLTTVGLSRSLTDLQVAQQTAATTRAFHVAETGIDVAVVDLANGGCEAGKLSFGHGSFKCAISVLALPANSGTYKIFATQLAPAPSEKWKLIAEGTVQSLTESVTAYVTLTPLTVFQDALFGGNSVDIQGTIFTDSYDSSVGTYGQIVNGVPNKGLVQANIGTNSSAGGAVTFNENNPANNSNVDGVVQTGSGDPSTVAVTGADAPIINGEFYPDLSGGTSQLVAGTLPLPDVPTCVGATDVVIDGNNPATLDVPAEKIKWLTGDMCVQNFTVSNGAKLVPIDTQPYTITVLGNMNVVTAAVVGADLPPIPELGNLTTLNVGKPTVSILFPNPSSTLTVSTTEPWLAFAVVVAKIYGFDLSANIGGRGATFGSLIAGKQVTVAVAAAVIFDVALKTDQNSPLIGLNLVTIDAWTYNGTSLAAGGGGASSLSGGGSGGTSVVGGGSFGLGL